MPVKARCQITVRHYECDPLGHVNHAAYVHYFEVGRLTAMAAAGLPFGAILKQGYTVVAVDLYVQYKAPAFTDDVLDVESCISRFHGALMTWQQAISRRSDGALVALAEVNGAFTRADGRPTRIPPAMRALLETVCVLDEPQVGLRHRRRQSPSP
jgi:YbgC/YbaW family acyl-CoA thioester hydrolase